MKTLLSLVTLLFLLTGCSQRTAYYTTNITPVKAGISLAAAKIYVQNGRINETDATGNTALIYAATNDNYLEVTKYLVSNGAQMKLTKKHYGPMWQAISGGNIKTIQFYLDKGLEIQKEVPNNINPIEHLNNMKKIYIDAKNKSSNATLVRVYNNSIDKMKKTIELLTPYYNKGFKEFEIVKNINTLEAYFGFIEKNPSSPFVSNAKENMAQLEYNALLNPNKMQYLTLMNKYPNFSKNNEIREKIKLLNNKEATLAFAKIKENKNIKEYEAFILMYPNSFETNEAKSFILQQKAKKIMNKINSYLVAKDINGLLTYINSDSSIRSIGNSIPITALLFTGPDNLNVITILKYKKQGFGDAILSSKIKSIKKPYKDFSLDEISTLKNYGLSETLIAAMLDSTASYDDKLERQKKQQELLNKQKEMKLSQEKELAKIKRQNEINARSRQKSNTKQQNSNPLLDKATDKLFEAGAKKLFDHFF